MNNRCYLRGTTKLGIFNTIIGCLFNRVLVRVRDLDSGGIEAHFWDKATNWPPDISPDVQGLMRKASSKTYEDLFGDIGED